MEDLGSTPLFDGLGNATRRKRSQTSRRPRPDSQPVSDGRDLSPLSLTPPSDDVSKVSSEENAEVDKSHKSKRDGSFHAFYNNEPGRNGPYDKRSSEGVLAPANWKGSGKLKHSLESDSGNAEMYSGNNLEMPSLGQLGVSQDGLGNENRVKKFKLKLGGVTHTIQTNTTSNNASDKKSGLQGLPWKDFSRGGFGLGKEESSMGRLSGKNKFGKQGDKTESVWKSKRVPKRRVLDGELSDDDDEIRYLEKLKTSRVSAMYRDEEKLSKKHKKLSSVSYMENASSSRSGRDGKTRLRSDRVHEDNDYEEEEESGSDGELEDRKKKKQRKESVDVMMDTKREKNLMTRQRALQSSKDASASLIEFPNGLPPPPPRKQKEKLTEVEQQLKKAEAAQRRRMQAEKAARESEAEAIRKILGQDSNRKKQEDKMKKRREELAQEKAANALKLAPNTIRYVMGPSGTTVTFPEEMGLPSIFNSKPCSYPPPREICAGPSCTNPYKYRHSKSKLPLCSLQCYKAVQGKVVAETV
ncbi:hypothetical protein TanjilG_15447 [Lupinus angustifolius]|uniref:INO80 complex subunit B-like conserved region domain-containing protein n=1 Tax=Lupinus angustifolius TaxID=3871 RepID=A0A4P1RL60_LUPAN|nr:PREDICTED: titin homolog [Lupinus angustifolius]OIW12998.1 hypothetical protein TanjilG_15447 [Lupinus angustifolius]